MSITDCRHLHAEASLRTEQRRDTSRAPLLGEGTVRPMSVRLFPVEEDEDGMRLDRWLRHRFAGLPQGRIGKLLRTGQVRVNGGRARPNRRLSAGEQVRVPSLRPVAPVTGPSMARPPPEDVRMFARLVLHRDGSVLAINKPAGLAVQGGSGQRRSVDRIASAWVGDGGDAPRLVHRIDRDTSGVLLSGNEPAGGCRSRVVISGAASAKDLLGRGFRGAVSGQRRDRGGLGARSQDGPAPHAGRNRGRVGRAGGQHRVCNPVRCGGE